MDSNIDLTSAESRCRYLGTLLSLNMALPPLGHTFTDLSSPRMKKYPHLSSKGAYFRCGRCVMKIEFNHTSTIVIQEREAMLRNILLCLLIFQRSIRVIKNSRLSGYLLKARLLVLHHSLTKKYSRMSLDELWFTLNRSLAWELKLFLAIPRIMVIDYFPNASDMVFLLLHEYNLFTAAYYDPLTKADTPILYALHGFVVSCIRSTMRRRRLLISSVTM